MFCDGVFMHVFVWLRPRAQVPLHHTETEVPGSSVCEQRHVSSRGPSQRTLARFNHLHTVLYSNLRSRAHSPADEHARTHIYTCTHPRHIIYEDDCSSLTTGKSPLSASHCQHTAVLATGSLQANGKQRQRRSHVVDVPLEQGRSFLICPAKAA